MRINVNNITATTADGVREQVLDVLRYMGCITANSQEEVERIFGQYGYAPSDVHEDDEQRFSVLGEIEGNYQPTISVIITAHFIDGGSDDYVYTVRVTEA